MRRRATANVSSIARLNAASFAFDGAVKPLSFRTNCSDAARISSSVAGGSKLKRVLMFRHIGLSPWIFDIVSGFRSHSAAAHLFDDGERHVDSRRNAGRREDAVVHDTAVALHVDGR